jgi:hypothetical protein
MCLAPSGDTKVPFPFTQLPPIHWPNTFRGEKPIVNTKHAKNTLIFPDLPYTLSFVYPLQRRINLPVPLRDMKQANTL